jgi:hypothetical protein
VGIGTANIDVSTQAGGSGYKALQIESNDGGQLNFDHPDAGTGSTLGQINFQRAGEVVSEMEGVTDGATDNGRLVFRTQPDGGALTERMRIDHDGNVFINTLNDMGGILNTSHADGVAIGSANDQGYYRRIYGTSGANLELRFWNGSNEGSLNSSGAWVNASDVSLKENIADIEYGIDTVKSLKPRKYTMKEGGNSEVGFIAQEMESVVPEVVNTSENPNKDEIKGISYGQLTAVLTKALQEAIAKIETLETKVAALEAG